MSLSDRVKEIEEVFRAYRFIPFSGSLPLEQMLTSGEDSTLLLSVERANHVMRVRGSKDQSVSLELALLNNSDAFVSLVSYSGEPEWHLRMSDGSLTTDQGRFVRMLCAGNDLKEKIFSIIALYRMAETFASINP